MHLYIWPIFLPLLSAIIVGLLGNRFSKTFAQWFSTACLLVSATLGALVFYQVAWLHQHTDIHLWTWLDLPSFQVAWGLKFDVLSSLMIFVVTIVSSMVHLYSIGYMHQDKGVPRFMAYLSLFTFFMLMLVTAPNLLQLFFGWEGVGLASYLLIGFWHEKDSATTAAMKAFLVNRVGDVSFAMGILLIFLLTNALSFSEIFSKLPDIATITWTVGGTSFSATTVIALLLFGGAMGKSAQLGLHIWLPDAMEGPTPVSALIHAATMVTAGIFLMARMSPLIELSSTALMVIACVGAATAFFAGTIALTQTDIKRVIAYSTCSQLGYMFFAIGLSAYSAAIFHLFTHAFFKALLFLGAGSVIHALSDEQDMTRMGGIFRHIPFTYGFMWIGTLALTGTPFFAGYYSKDLILEWAAATRNPLGETIYYVGLFSALLTAVYSWRLMFLVFHGKPRADERVLAHIHESPCVMLFPLFVLALGAIFSGYGMHHHILNPQFWQGTITVLGIHDMSEKLHHIDRLYRIFPFMAGVLGLSISAYIYLKRPFLADALQQSFPRVHKFLVNKWYIDELYQRLFIQPAERLGFFLWKSGDAGLLDPYIPDGAARIAILCSKWMSRCQTGFVAHYAMVFFVGLIGIIAWVLISSFFDMRGY